KNISAVECSLGNRAPRVVNRSCWQTSLQDQRTSQHFQDRQHRIQTEPSDSRSAHRYCVCSFPTQKRCSADLLLVGFRQIANCSPEGAFHKCIIINGLEPHLLNQICIPTIT